MSLQSERQAAIRAITGTAGTYNEDMLAFVGGTGTYNERMITFLQGALNSSKTSLPALQAEAAKSLGKTRWQDIGEEIGELSLASLFADRQGLYSDPLPTTSYEDAAGTDPSAVGESVGLRLDSSGGGNNLVQPTSAAKPTLQSEIINGRTVYYDSYDGGDYLDTGLTSIDGATLFCGESDRWLVAGVYRVSGTPTDRMIITRGSSSLASTTLMLFADASGNLSFRARGSANLKVADDVFDNLFHVLVANWDGSQFATMHDSLAPVMHDVGIAAEEVDQRIIIGAANSGTFAPMVGDIGTTIIRPGEHSLALRQRIMRSLAAEYGVVLT